MRDYAKQVDPEPYTAPCVSCHKPYPISGVGCMQAGHFITSKKMSIRYDEKNVHAQCYNCNINLKGNWDAYYDSMITMYGQDSIEELKQKRFEITKYSAYELEEMTNHYKMKLKDLTDFHGDPFK